ncbi:fimbrial protein, partial [Vibrio sinaloensis]
MKNKLALLGLSLFLLGCQANEESLDEFVAQVERKAR